ncbi:hypothetical protein M0811_14677 [Anaeramoeba ignava]|uniref:Uncharacterized protein n=1 Tax=Anaeramoeba ignava TaxID=1746090 RepID=A0A9Q0R9M0_ANAIG|nr:hypothetical protein M0811_09584 [Anaeramoeba ignava]KAJ5079014.1 hypothetical protein M0811_14677 [Anaeramoeba ignava]
MEKHFKKFQSFYKKINQVFEDWKEVNDYSKLIIEKILDISSRTSLFFKEKCYGILIGFSNIKNDLISNQIKSIENLLYELRKLMLQFEGIYQNFLSIYEEIFNYFDKYQLQMNNLNICWESKIGPDFLTISSFLELIQTKKNIFSNYLLIRECILDEIEKIGHVFNEKTQKKWEELFDSWN